MTEREVSFFHKVTDLTGNALICQWYVYSLKQPPDIPWSNPQGRDFLIKEGKAASYTIHSSITGTRRDPDYADSRATVTTTRTTVATTTTTTTTTIGATTRWPTYWASFSSLELLSSPSLGCLYVSLLVSGSLRNGGSTGHHSHHDDDDHLDDHHDIHHHRDLFRCHDISTIHVWSW